MNLFLLRQPLIENLTLRVRIEIKTESDSSKTLERIVLSHGEPKLGARGEKAIWLVYTARNEVVNQNSDVRGLAAEDKGVASERSTPCIDTGKHSLPRCLLVARRAVDLASEVETLDGLHLKRGIELRWRIVVVLDGISRSIHPDILESRDRSA